MRSDRDTISAVSSSNIGLNNLTILRNKIKALESIDINKSIDNEVYDGTDVQIEQVLINRRVVKVRRVYLVNSKYRIGWIVDSDVASCMICMKDFSWLRPRHHCRYCGSLICSKCAPHRVVIEIFEEQGGSRSCVNCFASKGDTTKNSTDVIQTPSIENNVDYRRASGAFSLPSRTTDSNKSSPDSDFSIASPLPSLSPSSSFIEPIEVTLSRIENVTANRLSRRRITTSARYLPSDIKLDFSNKDSNIQQESSQFNSRPKSLAINHFEPTPTLSPKEVEIKKSPSSMISRDIYKEEDEVDVLKAKCLESYMTMRSLIPADITKTTYNDLVNYGLPESVANRIWKSKSLWLICMHQEDILKVHIADLRGKFDYHGLDLIEMQAIWYNLPTWGMEDVNEIHKRDWKDSFRSKLESMMYRDMKSSLPQSERRNPAYSEVEGVVFFDPQVAIKPRYKYASSSFNDIKATPPPIVGSDLTLSISEEYISMNTYSSQTTTTMKPVKSPGLDDLQRLIDSMKESDSSSQSRPETIRKVDDNIEGDKSDTPLADDRSSIAFSDINIPLEIQNIQNELNEVSSRDSNLSNNSSRSISPMTAMLESMRLEKSSSSSSIKDKDTNKISHVVTQVPDETINDRIINCIRSGKAKDLKALLDHPGYIKPSKEEASQLLLELCQLIALGGDINIEVIAYLVEECEAQTDITDMKTGNCLMHYLVMGRHETISEYLLDHGCHNILATNFNSETVLSRSITLLKQDNWLVQVFEESGLEDDFLKTNSYNDIHSYTTSLIFGGYASKVSTLISEGHIDISSSEATILFRKCRGNFDNMIDPIETFELLERLGATM